MIEPQRLKNALIVLLYSILVGLIYALPHIWLWQDAGQEWSFPHFNVPDERGVYAGRIRALYNGEKLGPAPQTLACPDGLTLFPATGEVLTYAAGRILGLGTRGCLILADFLFPAISILGFYLFLRALGCSARLSRLGPLMLYLLDPLLASRGPAVAILKGLSWLLGRELIPSWNCSFLFSRMISPETAMPLLGFACFCSVKAIRGGRLPWSIAAGIMCGLTACAHLSAGLPLLLGLFLFGAGTRVTGKGPIPLGRFVLMGTAALIVLAPRILQLHRFFHHPGSLFVIDRYATQTHAAMGMGYLVLMLLFMLPFFFLYKKRDLTFGFFLSIMGANLICMNLQVVSGFDFGIIHYFAYSFVPLTFLGYFSGISNRLEQNRGVVRSRGFFRRAGILELLLCLYSLSNGFFIQQAHYRADRLQWEQPSSRWLEYQSLGPVLDWFEENAAPREVVVSSPETTDLYAIYAPTKVLAQFMLQGCPFPTEAYLDRYLMAFKVYGLRWEQVEPLASDLVYEIHMTAETWRSGTWARAQTPPILRKPEVLSLMKKHYESLPEGDALDHMLRELNVRYVIFGTFEKALPGATDAHLKSGKYQLCFEENGHQVFERVRTTTP